MTKLFLCEKFATQPMGYEYMYKTSLVEITIQKRSCSRRGNQLKDVSKTDQSEIVK